MYAVGWAAALADPACTKLSKEPSRHHIMCSVLHKIYDDTCIELKKGVRVAAGCSSSVSTVYLEVPPKSPKKGLIGKLRVVRED
jgi:hypothetical protein